MDETAAGNAVGHCCSSFFDGIRLGIPDAIENFCDALAITGNTHNYSSTSNSIKWLVAPQYFQFALDAKLYRITCCQRIE
jgi:hypothetical protein